MRHIRNGVIAGVITSLGSIFFVGFNVFVFFYFLYFCLFLGVLEEVCEE